MSCASCHSPEHAYGPPNCLAVQLGGADMRQPGTRSVPSLRYLSFTPLFSRHFYTPASEDTEDEGPTGGFMRDGAAASLHDQASMPPCCRSGRFDAVEIILHRIARAIIDSAWTHTLLQRPCPLATLCTKVAGAPARVMNRLRRNFAKK
ncbi:hypothetical protein OKW46_005822 [Paraburkholderia sp. WSM4179]|nr:hypothetical protein [Paraburkholderia sp. WSM4179]